MEQKTENRGKKRKHPFPSKNEIFNYWTVIDETPIFDRKQWKVLCKCKCGTEAYVRVNALQSGLSKGCQCRAIDNRKKQMVCEGELSKTKFSIIKKSARVRNLEFAVTMKYLWGVFLNQNKKCALTNIKLILTKNNDINVTASLDRIDSSKGYIEGNVQWVHKDVNRMKQDFDENYFIKICNLVVKNKKKINE